MPEMSEQRAFPCNSDEDHGKAGCPLAVQGGPRWCRYPHVARGRDPMQAFRWMPEGSCEPMGSPRWSRLLPGPVEPWREEPTPEQVCWQGL